jgi:hypothetical protein
LCRNRPLATGRILSRTFSWLVDGALYYVVGVVSSAHKSQSWNPKYWSLNVVLSTNTFNNNNPKFESGIVKIRATGKKIRSQHIKDVKVL